MLYFKNSQSLENLSKELAKCTTGSKITNMLQNLELENMQFSEVDTKWKRLHEAFCNSHNHLQSDEKIIQCIEWIINPQNFISNHFEWIDHQNSLNKILQFDGLTISDSGKIKPIYTPKNFSMAVDRFSSLMDKLRSFDIHNSPIGICTKEILNEDYFDLIFESAKFVENRIRRISGLDLIGINLVNKCFDSKRPILVLNSLQTKEEQNQYFALKALLNFIFYNYRNPKAHKVKYFNPASELDAIEAMIIISKALYLLDDCSKSCLET